MVLSSDRRLGKRWANRLYSRPITVWSASFAIASVTVFVTVLGGTLVRLIDSSEFSSIGESLWWSLQTVTTVGYGDVVPQDVSGRIVGAVLMVSGVGFLAVVTGSIAAAFTQVAMRRRPDDAEDPLVARIDELIARVERLEGAVRDSKARKEPGA